MVEGDAKRFLRFQQAAPGELDEKSDLPKG